MRKNGVGYDTKMEGYINLDSYISKLYGIIDEMYKRVLGRKGNKYIEIT